MKKFEVRNEDGLLLHIKATATSFEATNGSCYEYSVFDSKTDMVHFGKVVHRNDDGDFILISKILVACGV